MADIEKVIKGMEHCLYCEKIRDCSSCQYYAYRDGHNGCVNQMKKEAIALLKEQPEIIRCKECKHQHEYKEGACPHYTTWGSVAPDEWFCADGEKREP